MKQIMKRMLVMSLCFTLLGHIATFNVSASDSYVDRFLLQTGMPQEEINQLDSDIKEYIVENLKSNTENNNLDYVEIDTVPEIMPLANQPLYNIVFSAAAFRNGSTIYIYPIYEFTADIKPKGNDSFAFQLGDAMLPYEYGGQVWYKDYTMNDWALGGSIIANTQSSNGGEYSGYQLGSPDWSMKFKGVAYCHAVVGTGTDQRIIMGYMHNPNNHKYSMSFARYGLGITYNSPNTVYTNASTVILSY